MKKSRIDDSDAAAGAEAEMTTGGASDSSSSGRQRVTASAKGKAAEQGARNGKSAARAVHGEDGESEDEAEDVNRMTFAGQVLGKRKEVRTRQVMHHTEQTLLKVRSPFRCLDDEDSFDFTTAYIRDLHNRLYPPTARTMEALAAFSPLSPPKQDQCGIMRSFAPLPATLRQVPFDPAALQYVHLGCESPFRPFEQLRVIYSPFTGTIQSEGRPGELLNPDEAVHIYQSQFEEFFQ